jgi:predicted MFS family arabinose efflux permease
VCVPDHVVADRTFRTVVLGTFLTMSAAYMVLPFLALYLSRTVHAPAATIGLILALSPLGALLGSTLSGALADRWQRRWVILLCLACTSLTMAAYPLSRDLRALAALTFLLGFSLRMFSPPSNALLADCLPEERQQAAFTTVRVAFNGGAAVGPVVGSVLLVRAPAAVFWVGGGVALGYAVIALLGLREPRRERPDRADRRPLEVAGYAGIVRRPEVLLLLVSTVLAAVTYFVLETVLSLALSERFRDGTALYTAILVTNAVAVVLLQVPLTRLLSRWRWSPLRSIVAGMLLYAVSLLAASLLVSEAWVYACFLAFALAELLVAANTLVLLARLSTPALRGRYMALDTVQWTVGGMASAPLGGLVLGTLGGPAMLIAFGLTGLLACLGYALFGRMAGAAIADDRPAMEVSR